jgi:YkoY family integral membrane protein
MNDWCLLGDSSASFWGQTFASPDILLILLLIFFEGVLSLDNAIVLGLLAKRLPKSQQRLALSYGMIGAFLFRSFAILAASMLLEWRIVKLLGGAYLLYIAIKHLFFLSHEEADDQVIVGPDGLPELRDAATGAELSESRIDLEIQERLPGPLPHNIQRLGKQFWWTVFVIEMTDIAFAIDSILAAIALVGSPPADHPEGAFHPKLWVIVAGGIIGIVLMRLAAIIFIRLLERYPRFETSAYLLILVIAAKLLADWGFNSKTSPHVIDFHDWSRIEFWLFWGGMLACLAIGFWPKKKRSSETSGQLSN